MKIDEKSVCLVGPKPGVPGLRALPMARVAIHADGVDLAGELAVPPHPRGIVLIAHGSSRLSPLNRLVAERTRAAGLATFLFDLLTPTEERTNGIGDQWQADIGLLAYRLIGAVRWLGRQQTMASLGLGLFGTSIAAAAALDAAAGFGPAVRAVVSQGGRPDLAGAAVTRVTAPTLLIVGRLDADVLQLNRRALNRMHCKRQLSIVPGATPLLEEPGALEVVAELATEWFTRYLPFR